MARASTEGITVVDMEKIFAPWRPQLLSVLRIVTALLFLEHGTQKLFNFPASQFQPSLFSLMGAAGVIELVGGILLLIGLFTRPVAFVLSGETAFAYFIGHAPHSFFPIQNFGEAAILFCFIFLYIAAAGAGPWSVDHVRATVEAPRGTG
jgi:putative oxidoreductase